MTESGPVATLPRPRWSYADVALGVLTLAAALALKAAYSGASADALYWVLAPSCWVAAALGGLDMTWEPLAGFVSHDARMIVGPACAGVNFLVVAWLALYFTCHAAFPDWRRKSAWLGASLLAAFLATSVANGVRIVFAGELHTGTLLSGLLSESQAHRLLGVVVYCVALLTLCRTGAWATGSARVRTLGAHLHPFAWYVGVVVLVPLVHRGFAGDAPALREHVTVALIAGSAVVSAFWLGSLLLLRVSSARS